MGFGTSTTFKISTASDAYVNNAAQSDVLIYNASTSKWNNAGLSGTFALSNNGGQETVATGTSTGSYTLNLANGNVQRVTLGANTTFTVSGAASGKACAFTLYLYQDGTGSRTVTWPTGTKWSGGAPTLSTAANAIDIVVLESLDGGSTWFGSLVGTNYQ